MAYLILITYDSTLNLSTYKKSIYKNRRVLKRIDPNIPFSYAVL